MLDILVHQRSGSQRPARGQRIRELLAEALLSNPQQDFFEFRIERLAHWVCRVELGDDRLREAVLACCRADRIEQVMRPIRNREADPARAHLT